MTALTPRRPFDLFAFLPQSGGEQQSPPARPPALHRGRFSFALCLGAIAIGIIALTGYVLGAASLSSLSANGKPVAALTGLALIVLGAGLLALRLPAPAGVLTARRAALAVIVIAAADLLSLALSGHIEEWQVWAARGGVNVHAYPVAAFLMIALGSALVFITTRSDFASHVIASAVLLICAVLSFAYLLAVPSFLDPSTRVVPAAAATIGIVLISVAELLARPRGWVVPLLSRTSAGLRSRLLLVASIVVPFVALGLRALLADARWFTPEVGLTVIVAVNVLFGAAIVLSVGVILLRRESDRARLASIVDSSTDSIVGISVSGVIESWNTGAERMYGYTAAEAVGRSIAMLAPPECDDEVSLLRERVRRGERIDPFETMRVAKDGRRIDVWLSVSPVLDDEGNVVGASSITHDITSRKEAEAVIRRQAEQHTTMLATSSDGFWLVDLEGRLLEVNDAYCRMSGYTREELLKLRISDIDATETPEQTASRIRSIAESGFARFESKHRTKDNRILDIENSVSLWRATGLMLVFVRDITQRKQEHEALQRSEERYALLADAAHDLIILVNRDWRIEFANTFAARQVGVSSTELIGKKLGEIFPARIASRQQENLQKVLDSGQPLHVEAPVIFPDKSDKEVWLGSWLVPVKDKLSGETNAVLVVSRDITERRQAAEAVQLAHERLQTLSRRLLEIHETERRQIARELHDEIGQALTATKIILQSLQRYPEPATITERLSESVRIVERALAQVRSISLDLRPPLLDDMGLPPALRWLTDQHTNRTGLRVEFRSSATDARFDEEVETACFRVAQEALTNVFRHAGARHVTVELQVQDDGLHLRVSDDGAGFDVPRAHRQAVRGASLGLLGMEERAKLAGGGLEYRSTPGQGTEVHAWFPLPRPAGTNDETPAAA